MKKILTLGFGILTASALLVTGCNNNEGGNDSGAGTSSGVSSSSFSGTVAERIQPKSTPVFTVGETFNIREYVTLTPEDATLIVTSRNEDVAVVKEDGVTVEIVGSGESRLNLMSGSKSAIMTIKAMSKAQKTMQELADSVTTHYFIDGLESYVDENGNTFEDSEGYDTSYFCARKLTEDYIWDGVFSTNYNAIKLSDGNTYSFDLMYNDTIKAPHPDYFNKLVVGSQAPSAYLTDYFVIDQGTLIDISDFEEVKDEAKGTTSFVTTDTAVANNFLLTLYGFNPSFCGELNKFELSYNVAKKMISYSVLFKGTEEGTGEHAGEKGVYIDLDDDDEYETFAHIEFSGDIYTTTTKSKITLCDDYIASGELPTKPDSSAIRNTVSPYKEQHNYTVTLTDALVNVEYDDSFTEAEVKQYEERIDTFYTTTTATFTENAVLYTTVTGNPEKESVEKTTTRAGLVNKDGSYYAVVENDKGELELGNELGKGSFYDAFKEPTVKQKPTTSGNMMDFYTYDLLGNVDYLTDEIIDNAWFQDLGTDESGVHYYTQSGGDNGMMSQVMIGLVLGELNYASYAGTAGTLAIEPDGAFITSASHYTVFKYNSSYTAALIDATEVTSAKFESLGTTRNAEIDALLA